MVNIILRENYEPWRACRQRQEELELDSKKLAAGKEWREMLGIPMIIRRLAYNTSQKDKLSSCVNLLISIKITCVRTLFWCNTHKLELIIRDAGTLTWDACTRQCKLKRQWLVRANFHNSYMQVIYLFTLINFMQCGCFFFFVFFYEQGWKINRLLTYLRPVVYFHWDRDAAPCPSILVWLLLFIPNSFLKSFFKVCQDRMTLFTSRICWHRSPRAPKSTIVHSFNSTCAMPQCRPSWMGQCISI